MVPSLFSRKLAICSPPENGDFSHMQITFQSKAMHKHVYLSDWFVHVHADSSLHTKVCLTVPQGSVL